MKIIFLTRYFWPHIGGVEKHIEEVSQALIKQGYSITIITLNHGKKLPNFQKYRGLNIVRIPNTCSKWKIWLELWRRRKILKKAEVIHCHDVFFWYFPFRFLWPNKKIFTTFHGWEGIYPIPKKNIFMHLLAEKLSNGNICVGSYLKKWYGHKPDFITYGGINIPFNKRKEKKISTQIKEIIFIGRLEKDLALPEYIKAIKIIKKKYNFHITFIGDGTLKQRAKKIGKVAGTIFDLKSYLVRKAAIFTSSYLTIWEALVNGRIVFCLYQNQLKKDYLEEFPLADFINISGSAKKLVKQFNEVIKRKQAQKLPLCQLNCFTWEKVSKIYLKLWRK